MKQTSGSSWLKLSPRQAFALTALCILYIGFRWGQFVAHPEKAQDFNIYYYSALADQQGINEYSVDGLKQVSNGATKFLFVYPPYVLPVFKPFLQLDVSSAVRLFLLLKTLAFALLFWLWLKYLPRENRATDIAFMLLLVSVGYYECTYTDFKNGNISVFEQFFLWSGFYFFTRTKYALFALFVLLASFFKLALIPFLGVLLFVPGRKGWLPFACGCLAFVGLQASSYFYNPAEYMQFLGSATGLEETGPLNPSSMMLSRATFTWLSKDIANAIYFVFASAIAIVFLRTAWPSKKRPSLDAVFLLIGYCFLYAIVMPRFKNYSFILLLLPTYWMLQNVLPQKKWLFPVFISALVAHVAPYQTWTIAACMLFFWFRSARPRTS